MTFKNILLLLHPKFKTMNTINTSETLAAVERERERERESINISFVKEVHHFHFTFLKTFLMKADFIELPSYCLIT